jgi:pimeloyl-ACP methyl ester carboxylesterase
MSTLAADARRALILAAGLFLATWLAPSAAQAACGGLNQRACNVWERIPSCNRWLIERVESCGTFCVQTMCRDNGCGGDGERACVPFIDHAYSNVCQGLLQNVAGTCRNVDSYGFPSFCGHDGQAACSVAVQASLGISSCIPGHFEEGFPSGICRALDADDYPQFCGDQGEMACDLSLQAQLFILPCKLGLEDWGVCMEPVEIDGPTGSWPAGEHVPSGIADAERAVFVLHGMSSSRQGKDDAHVRTLVEAGHRVFLVDYASDNEADDRDPLTIQEVKYAWASDTTTVEPVWSSTATFHGLSLTLNGVAASLALGIDALVPGRNVALVGHSMGGLVSRILVDGHYDWLRGRGTRITEVVTLGSPHDGSNLDLGTWADTFLPEWEANFLLGLLGNAALGSVTCAGLPVALVALDAASLVGVGADAIWPRAMYQNCQMEGFHLEVGTSTKTLDNRDFPHIGWGLVAGSDAGRLDDGAVPIASALGIAADALVVVAGHHSESPSVLDAAATQALLREVIGVAADLSRRACSNGFDDDGDGLEDAADPDCNRPEDPSESPTPRCGDVGAELALVFAALPAGAVRRRLRA